MSSPIAQDPGGLNLEDFQSDPFSARGLNVTYNARERLTHSKVGSFCSERDQCEDGLERLRVLFGAGFRRLSPF